MYYAAPETGAVVNTTSGPLSALARIKAGTVYWKTLLLGDVRHTCTLPPRGRSLRRMERKRESAAQFTGSELGLSGGRPLRPSAPLSYGFTESCDRGKKLSLPIMDRMTSVSEKFSMPAVMARHCVVQAEQNASECWAESPSPKQP